jgi:hypothetical protein
MTITAKFSSSCPTCHAPITVGERVEWSRGNPARHLVCPAVTVPGDCEHPQFHRSDCVCAKSFPRGTDADDRSYDAWLPYLDGIAREAVTRKLAEEGPSHDSPAADYPRQGAWCAACQDRHDLPLCGPNADLDYARGDDRQARINAWLAKKGFGS